REESSAKAVCRQRVLPSPNVCVPTRCGEQRAATSWRILAGTWFYFVMEYVVCNQLLEEDCKAVVVTFLHRFLLWEQEVERKAKVCELFFTLFFCTLLMGAKSPTRSLQ
ncbi:unnamed protein product, partial [Hapterophycus canaliculatus]